MSLKRNGDIFPETYCTPFQALRENWVNNSWKVEIYFQNSSYEVQLPCNQPLWPISNVKRPKQIISALIRDTFAFAFAFMSPYFSGMCMNSEFLLRSAFNSEMANK